MKAVRSKYFYSHLTPITKSPLIFAYIYAIIVKIITNTIMGVIMNNSIPTETERKFLISFPDIAFLEGMGECRKTDIVQTYLLCENGSMRVRKASENNEVRYIRNIKKRISDMSHLEDEREISSETYEELLLCRDAERSDIIKTRFSFPFKGHIMEIDVYPFWQDRAVLEVELECEDEKFDVPDFLKIIKEVTYDKRYSNKALSKEIVYEEL